MNDTLTLVQSYLQWWDMAGFDHAVDDKSLDWLESKEKKRVLRNQNNESLHQNQNPIQPHLTTSSKPRSALKQSLPHIAAQTLIDEQQWPQTLDDLHIALRNGDHLPGNHYSSDKLLPRTIKSWAAQATDMPDNGIKQSAATIMLIGDIPNEQDIREKMIFSGTQNNVIVNMMTAANFNNFDIYCTNIATTKPQFDELPQQDLPSLYALLRHHIALLKPNAIISFGSACCNALLNAELMNSRENLHYFNHNNINKPLIATFHPRSLIAQPQLKRQAWKDLQVLMKKDIL